MAFSLGCIPEQDILLPAGAEQAESLLIAAYNDKGVSLFATPTSRAAIPLSFQKDQQLALLYYEPTLDRLSLEPGLVFAPNNERPRPRRLPRPDRLLISDVGTPGILEEITQLPESLAEVTIGDLNAAECIDSGGCFALYNDDARAPFCKITCDTPPTPIPPMPPEPPVPPTPANPWCPDRWQSGAACQPISLGGCQETTPTFLSSLCDGALCPVGRWPSEIPPHKIALYVDQSAIGGGNGSVDSPFDSLQVALSAVQDRGTIIVLAQGVYAGPWNLENVALVGGCPTEVELQGTLHLSGDAELNSLTAEHIEIAEGSRVELTRVVVQTALQPFALEVGEDAQLQAQQLLVRSEQSGVRMMQGSLFELEGGLLRAQQSALTLTGASDAQLQQVILQSATEALSLAGAHARLQQSAIYAQGESATLVNASQGASLALERSALFSDANGIRLQTSTASITDTSVRLGPGECSDERSALKSVQSDLTGARIELESPCRAISTDASSVELSDGQIDRGTIQLRNTHSQLSRFSITDPSGSLVLYASGGELAKFSDITIVGGQDGTPAFDQGVLNVDNVFDLQIERIVVDGGSIAMRIVLVESVRLDSAVLRPKLISEPRPFEGAEHTGLLIADTTNETLSRILIKMRADARGQVANFYGLRAIAVQLDRVEDLDIEGPEQVAGSLSPLFTAPPDIMGVLLSLSGMRLERARIQGRLEAAINLLLDSVLVASDLRVEPASGGCNDPGSTYGIHLFSANQVELERFAISGGTGLGGEVETVSASNGAFFCNGIGVNLDGPGQLENVIFGVQFRDNGLNAFEPEAEPR